MTMGRRRGAIRLHWAGALRTGLLARVLIRRGLAAPPCHRQWAARGMSGKFVQNYLAYVTPRHGGAA